MLLYIVIPGPITHTSVSTYLYLYSPIIIILFDNATCNLAIFYSTTVFLIFNNQDIHNYVASVPGLPGPCSVFRMFATYT